MNRKQIERIHADYDEHTLQRAVAQLFTTILQPPVWWSGIDHGVGKLTVRAAASMKLRGVRRGLPDFMILAPGLGTHGLELKLSDTYMTPPQRVVREAWLACGARWAVARSIDEVMHQLVAWRIPHRVQWLPILQDPSPLARRRMAREGG